MDNTNRIIASLNYFSIFFAPFLFPIIVFFITNNQDVRYHAKRALFSHLIPILILIIMFILSLTFIFSKATGMAIGALIVGYLASAIIYFIFMIWNIIQGIRLFT